MPFAPIVVCRWTRATSGPPRTLGTSGRVAFSAPAERGLRRQHERSEDDVGEHGAFAFGEEQQLRVAFLQRSREELDRSVLGDEPRAEGDLRRGGAAAHQRVGRAAGKAFAFELCGFAGFQAEVARGDAEPGRQQQFDVGDRREGARPGGVAI